MLFITATLVVTLLVGINALYVAAEFAAVKSRKTRLVEMATAGNPTAQNLLPTLQEGKALDDYVAACQIGITISSIGLGAYSQRVISAALTQPIAQLLNQLGIPISPDLPAQTIAAAIAIWGVLILITTLQVVLGELLPKSIAIQYPEDVALSTFFPMRLSLLLYRPLIWFFNGSGSLILRLFGQPTHAHGQAHSLEEIQILVAASNKGGLLEDEERQMLRNTLRLRDLNARQVMVHRTRMVTAPIESTVRELLDLAIENGYTRIPLYKGTPDRVAGIVHVKDLFHLYVKGETDPTPVHRQAAYVPETLPVVDVWELFRRTGQYMVIVFDEYGGTAGLITLEDLIEEIFGELQDEFDTDEETPFNEDEQGRYHLRGDLLVTDVNEYLHLRLPEEAADTLSGLIFTVLGHIPTEKEELTVNGVNLRVEKMLEMGVAEISIPKPPAEFLERIPEWEVHLGDE